MSWLCYKCETVNGSSSSNCSWCNSVKQTVSRLDYYDDYNAGFLFGETSIIILANQQNEFLKRINQENKMSASDTMTREEKLFAKFFNDEKILVSQMDDFQLKAHIEELQDIAREARARLTCSTGEDRERNATRKSRKGIHTSVESDDFTSEAINNIRNRTAKLSKTEKEIERLVSMGISRVDAENMYKATTINQVQKLGAQGVIEQNKRLDVQIAINSVMNPNPPENKAFTNPFAPPEKPKETLPVNAAMEIPQESTEVKAERLVKPLVEEKTEKPKFINPFAKKE